MEENIFQHSFTKSIEIYSNENLIVKERDGKMPLVELNKNRPLVILLSWLDAKPKHAKKYVDLYLKKGFDVLKVSTSMWQLMWPTYGVRVSASFVLEFLHENEGFQPLFAHGLSCGTYAWSEVLVKAATDMEKYESTINRIKGQVFDSPPGAPPQFQKGFAVALFPNNYILSLLFEYAITFQLYLFYNIVTKHLIKGYEVAHNPPKSIPSLLFISKNDPISPFDLNMNMYECWKKNGMKAYIKWWEDSPHVGHYKQHQEEYIERLNSLLDSVGLGHLVNAK